MNSKMNTVAHSTLYRYSLNCFKKMKSKKKRKDKRGKKPTDHRFGNTVIDSNLFDLSMDILYFILNTITVEIVNGFHNTIFLRVFSAALRVD